MKITLYLRSYPVKGSPVSLSFLPDAEGQRFTFTAEGREHEAERRQLQIVVPEEASLLTLKNLLVWSGEKGRVQSTAKEVYELAMAKESGFRMA